MAAAVAQWVIPTVVGAGISLLNKPEAPKPFVPPKLDPVAKDTGPTQLSQTKVKPLAGFNSTVKTSSQGVQTSPNAMSPVAFAAGMNKAKLGL